MKRQVEEVQEERRYLMSEYGKRKLLAYADSFQELARSFDHKFDWEEEGEERPKQLYQRKLWENRCLLAENLKEMAQIMSQVAGEVFQYKGLGEKVQKQIVQALGAEKIQVKDLFFLQEEDGKKRIGGVFACQKMGGYPTAEVANMLSVLLDMRLVPSVVCPYFVESEFRYYTFVEEPFFHVLTGFARAVKETEEISGDNYSIVESEKGTLTILLSDGMGSGEKACKDSETVLDLMEKMLEAGYSYEKAVNLVNGTLLAAGEEQNMSTLDICQLDLYIGTCAFCKVGAAQSFIKRAHMVEKISARTLPLGIFRGIEAEIVERSLMDGDYIVMVSDGVVDALEEFAFGEDLCDIIGKLEMQNPKEIAQALLRYVIRVSKGSIRDDMTVIVVGVWETR